MLTVPQIRAFDANLRVSFLSALTDQDKRQNASRIVLMMIKTNPCVKYILDTEGNEFTNFELTLISTKEPILQYHASANPKTRGTDTSAWNFTSWALDFPSGTLIDLQPFQMIQKCSLVPVCEYVPKYNPCGKCGVGANIGYQSGIEYDDHYERKKHHNDRKKYH